MPDSFTSRRTFLCSCCAQDNGHERSLNAYEKSSAENQQISAYNRKIFLFY